MCVDRMIFFGEKSLRHAMSEVEIFYNHERPHQGLENKIIKPDFDEPKLEGDIECRSRLDGLMKYYFRKAA
jgi:putative transposase